MVFFLLSIIFLSDLPIPTPAPIRGDPVDCIGGPVDCIGGAMKGPAGSLHNSVGVSWFRNVKFQRFNDPILPNFHFMFSGR